MSEPKNPAEAAREDAAPPASGRAHGDLSSDDFDFDELADDHAPVASSRAGHPTPAAYPEPTAATHPTPAAYPEPTAAAHPTPAAGPKPAAQPEPGAAAWVEPEQVAAAGPERDEHEEPAAEREQPVFRARPTQRISSAAERPTTREFRLFDDIAGTAADRDFVRELRPAGTTPPDRPSHRPPLLVWVFTALFIALMAMCTFLYPAFSGYDEVSHVDMTYSYYNGNGFYNPGNRLLSAGVDKAHSNLQMPPRKPISDQKARPRGDRRSFDAYGGDVAGSYPVPNQMVQHPPLYYALGAGILRLFPNSGNWPYDQWVAALRYMSILMLAPLPILAWATTKTLVGTGPAAVAAAAIPLTIPNLARIGGSVNNDALLILLTGLVTWLLAKVLAGDLRKRTGVMIGIFTGLACLTKGFALTLPIFVILGYGLAMLRHRRLGWPALGFALLGTFLIGAWWWIRNLVLFGVVQPDGLGKVWSAKHYGAAKPGFGVGGFLQHFFPLMARRTWGGIGLPEVPEFSPTACYAWAAATILGILLGIGFGVRGRGGRLVALLLLVPTLAYLVIVMVGSVHHYLHNGMLAGVQGRYLYPTVVGVAALLGIGYARLVGQVLSGWLPLAVTLSALATQLLAWRDLVHLWWVPSAVTNDRADEVQQAFRGILRWSPWGHVATTVPFGAVIVLAVAAAIGAIAYGSRGHGEEEPYVSDDSSRAPESALH